MKCVIVTGGNSGIGKATADLFAEKGYKVYEFSRSGVSREKVTHITCDVTDESSIKNAFKTVAEEAGKIDVLVSNAGFGISGAAESTTLSQAKKQFDVNFFGSFLCAREAAGYMRKQNEGKIIFLSSMAAVLSIPFQMFYSASKSAVNSMTLALANELRPFRIKVCAVMPGDVKTGFTAAREKNDADDEIYLKRLTKSVETMEKDEQNGMMPEAIAHRIYSLAEKSNPKPLSTVGLQYKTFAFLSKVLPVRAVNAIVGLIYSR